MTVKTARAGLPFSLTWWSFTFPVGTVVTGTSQLALYTHANFLTYFIPTGTPAGVGISFDPPRWLVDGDVVRIEIDRVGILENPVALEPDT